MLLCFCGRLLISFVLNRYLAYIFCCCDIQFILYFQPSCILNFRDAAWVAEQIGLCGTTMHRKISLAPWPRWTALMQFSGHGLALYNTGNKFECDTTVDTQKNWVWNWSCRGPNQWGAFFQNFNMPYKLCYNGDDYKQHFTNIGTSILAIEDVQCSFVRPDITMFFPCDNFHAVNILVYWVWDKNFELFRCSSGSFIILLWHEFETFKLAPQMVEDVYCSCSRWDLQKECCHSISVQTNSLILYWSSVVVDKLVGSSRIWHLVTMEDYALVIMYLLSLSWGGTRESQCFNSNFQQICYDVLLFS